MFEEDFDGFLFDDEHASEVTFPGSEDTDRAIYDYPLEITEYARSGRAGGPRQMMEVAARYPKLLTPIRNFDLYPQGRLLVVHGQEFDVVDRKPDGTGWMEVRLTEHQPEPTADTGSAWR